ncbi:hypothetical protein Tdes44962_MAKER02638 [Teratosphaeria destructans]|uniref:Uncharacterized protein n=1 Tax=Teratosphaeria destructans TaxID=418781 RepID=A0A9W7STJ7_9PEZI|nr:hypothetical protein Tdes44962_MAKER02638 [Teratosphaeria destructans]
MAPAEQLAMFNLVRSQQYLLNQLQIQNAQLAEQNNSGAGYYGGGTWSNLANNPQQASTMPYDNTPMPSHTFGYVDRTNYDRPDLLHHYYGSGHGPQQHPSLLFEGPPSIEGMGGFGYHDRPSDQSFTGVSPSYSKCQCRCLLRPGMY